MERLTQIGIFGINHFFLFSMAVFDFRGMDFALPHSISFPSDFLDLMVLKEDYVLDRQVSGYIPAVNKFIPARVRYRPVISQI